MFIPEPKGTVERKRGFLKISYYIDEENGLKKRYVLLPLKGLAKKWTKVEAILISDYQNQHDGLLKNNISPTLKVSKPQELDSINHDDMNDVLQDLSELASPKESQPDDYPKIDVTKKILDFAGPGKDFFGIKLTPSNISSEYHTLIFHFPKYVKTFKAQETIQFD